WCPNDREKFVRAIATASDDASKLAALEASGLTECVAAKRNDLAAALDKISAALACDAANTQAGCGVAFRYIVQVYRDNTPDEVFVQTATAAALDPLGTAPGRTRSRRARRLSDGAPRLHAPHGDHPVSRQGCAGGAACGRAMARPRSARRSHVPHPSSRRDRRGAPHRPWRHAPLRARRAGPARG